MTKYMDYSSPEAQFSYDVNKSPLFKKDHQNLINILGVNQLNTLDNTSLLDIYLSKHHFVEPHYHQNAAELVYCISGAAIVSILNPFTKEILNYRISPGQVANVPQGWWHYEEATKDNTHLLAIFNSPVPEVVLGSDILKLTPSSVMSKNYCMNENAWIKTTEKVKSGTYIGPSCLEPERYSPPRETQFSYPPYYYQYQPNPYHYRQCIPKTF
ncbi:cupin domain-containing protein [Rossellomorea vietnamensis]|uniref:Cupin n=1 Tax=Rossellomorea vietnamensis TaxID=218284 RepID=A0A0P6W1H6_9BACI|nr:cupin domain-containing protein [Rossellomorea vietnamensis]KPL59607.1 cupin [Rossellomorea vietnamensis]